jgi:hypothetical protein
MGKELLAWFKKVSGTVVRSTLRAVPATVPDTFLNQEELGNLADDKSSETTATTDTNGKVGMRWWG